MNPINIIIDNTPLSVPAGTTIMRLRNNWDSNSPAVFSSDLSIEGACRVCIVEVTRQKTLRHPAPRPCAKAMNIKTNSPEIRQARRDLGELILDNHPRECQTCERDGNASCKTSPTAGVGTAGRRQAQALSVERSTMRCCGTPEKVFYAGGVCASVRKIPGVFTI